ncbi:hypothetical protein [Poseidonocella sedimentorum]|nr:hypothetical protein [Poseidonocella sedimentorum]
MLHWKIVVAGTSGAIAAVIIVGWGVIAAAWLAILAVAAAVIAVFILAVGACGTWRCLRGYRRERLIFRAFASQLAASQATLFVASGSVAVCAVLSLAAGVTGLLAGQSALAFPITVGAATLVLFSLTRTRSLMRSSDGGLLAYEPIRTRAPDARGAVARFEAQWSYNIRLRDLRRAVLARREAAADAVDYLTALDSGGSIRPVAPNSAFQPARSISRRACALGPALAAFLPYALAGWLVAALLPSGSVFSLPWPSSVFSFDRGDDDSLQAEGATDSFGSNDGSGQTSAGPGGGGAGGTENQGGATASGSGISTEGGSGETTTSGKAPGSSTSSASSTGLTSSEEGSGTPSSSEGNGGLSSTGTLGEHVTNGASTSQAQLGQGRGDGAEPGREGDTSRSKPGGVEAPAPRGNQSGSGTDNVTGEAGDAKLDLPRGSPGGGGETAGADGAAETGVPPSQNLARDPVSGSDARASQGARGKPELADTIGEAGHDASSAKGADEASMQQGASRSGGATWHESGDAAIPGEAAVTDHLIERGEPIEFRATLSSSDEETSEFRERVSGDEANAKGTDVELGTPRQIFAAPGEAPESIDLRVQNETAISPPTAARPPKQNMPAWIRSLYTDEQDKLP